MSSFVYKGEMQNSSSMFHPNYISIKTFWWQNNSRESKLSVKSTFSGLISGLFFRPSDNRLFSGVDALQKNCLLNWKKLFLVRFRGRLSLVLEVSVPKKMSSVTFGIFQWHCTLSGVLKGSVFFILVLNIRTVPLGLSLTYYKFSLLCWQHSYVGL